MEKLNNRKVELYTNIKDLNAKYHDIVDNLLIKYFPNTVWFVDVFDYNRVRISMLLDKTYPDGSYYKNTIEIDHGYESLFSYKDDENFHMNINPFTAGSFTLLENNDLREYYGMVGNLCSNDKFREELITILKNYYIEFKPVNDELKEIKNKIFKIEREAAEAQRREEANAEYNKFKSDAESNPDLYFVIDAGDVIHTGADERIIYRKKPVKILEETTSYDEGVKHMKRYYKSDYHKYKIIEASKIKFTE